MTDQITFSSFIPDRLTEAREARGNTIAELARSVKLDRRTISKIESGLLCPDDSQVHLLAKHLEFPLLYFYNSRIRPAEPNGPIFFRKLKSTREKTKKIAEQKIKWLLDIVSYLEDFFSFPPVNLPRFVISEPLSLTQDDIESYATKTRRFWGMKDGPIGDMVSVLESVGFIVGRAGIADTLDAFSTWGPAQEGHRPYIILDTSRQTIVRQRFNAAHELGHMLLHSALSSQAISDKRILDAIEGQANYFAGAFLLPRATFGAELKKALGNRNGYPRISDFWPLKKRWKISAQAMIFRGRQLGLIDRETESRLYKNLTNAGYRRIDPVDSEFANQTGFEEPAVVRSSTIELLAAANNQKVSGASMLMRLQLPLQEVIELTGCSQDLFKVSAENRQYHATSSDIELPDSEKVVPISKLAEKRQQKEILNLQ